MLLHNNQFLERVVIVENDELVRIGLIGENEVIPVVEANLTVNEEKLVPQWLLNRIVCGKIYLGLFRLCGIERENALIDLDLAVVIRAYLFYWLHWLDFNRLEYVFT